MTARGFRPFHVGLQTTRTDQCKSQSLPRGEHLHGQAHKSRKNFLSDFRPRILVDTRKTKHRTVVVRTRSIHAARWVPNTRDDTKNDLLRLVHPFFRSTRDHTIFLGNRKRPRALGTCCQAAGKAAVRSNFEDGRHTVSHV